MLYTFITHWFIFVGFFYIFSITVGIYPLICSTERTSEHRAVQAAAFSAPRVSRWNLLSRSAEIQEGTIMGQSRERRCHERVIPEKEVLAAIRPTFEKMGRVIDISGGGLSFEYSVLSDDPNENVNAEMELFMLNGQFYVHGIRCKVVYDAILSEQASPLANYKKTSKKRCGVQFTGLPEEQKKKIDDFLNS